MKWMQFLSVAAIAAMTVVGCQTKYETDRSNRGGNSGGNGGNGGGTVQPVNQPTLHSDWTIKYMGRTSSVDQNGKNLNSEVFKFGYTGDNYFIFRTLTAKDFQDLYKSDLKAFLEGEAKDVVTMAGNMDKKFYETDLVFKKDVQEVLFDILISGSYDGYIIEIGQDGKPTYGYAKLSFQVERETPLEEYLSWIGTWHLTDGYVGYDITIADCEPNYLYCVYGWETGAAVSTVMDGPNDWLYARFNHRDGKLYFYAQYIQTEFDEGLNTDVEEYFVGTYLTATSDKNGEVDAEGAFNGWDLASMGYDEEKNAVVLTPEAFDFDNGYHTAYHTMRFSRYCLDEFNWAHYNQGGVPSFTDHVISMVKTKADVAAPENIVVARRRTQPQVQKASSVRTYPVVR